MPVRVYSVQHLQTAVDVMAEAARLICDMRGKMPFDFIDINMGCPAPKIAGPVSYTHLDVYKRQHGTLWQTAR